MRTLPSSNAKARFAELLDDVERGETVVITRHGRPVARIVPFVAAEHEPAARKAALKALLQSASRRTLDMDWKAARDEGRK